MGQLNDEELGLCKKAFAQFDKDGENVQAARLFRPQAFSTTAQQQQQRRNCILCTGSGTIDVKEMKTALQSMGHTPSDEELFAIVHEVGQLGRTSNSSGRVAILDSVLHSPYRWMRITAGRLTSQSFATSSSSTTQQQPRTRTRQTLWMPLWHWAAT